MENKKITLVFFILSLFGLLISLIISQLDLQASIKAWKLIRIQDGLFYGMSAFALVFLILLFVPQSFSAWKKFAVWFVPLATLIFIFYPEPGSGDYFSPYPEQVYKWISIIYVAVSFFVILKSRKNRT